MDADNHPTKYVFVPLQADLYSELVRRSRRSDVSNYIEYSVSNFLERTQGDPHVWAEEYVEEAGREEAVSFRERFGNPTRGYQWQALFLPNGTRVRMSYRGGVEYAEVRHDRLLFDGESVSPSQFASRVADGTNRNAWRDLHIQFPGEASWKLADGLRRAATARPVSVSLRP